MLATLTATHLPSLSSPEIQRKINALRTINNTTNWFYLLREYLFLGTVIGLTLAFYFNRANWDLAWAWNVPVTLLAIILMGAGQHRLTNLAHEASHYMLFRNRKLGEFVSDWFCLFPLLSTTHHYRLQHLAHHQYVNDPERDPDIAQLEISGHRFRFPMARWLFVWHIVLKQFIWLPGLLRYIRARAKYSSTGGGTGPYESKGPHNRELILVGIVYLLGLAGVLTGLEMLGNPWLLAAVPLAMWLAVMFYYSRVPAGRFRQTLVRPELSPRVSTYLRVTHVTLLYTLLAWLSYFTDKPWGFYYILLWLVPLVTAFSFFMILRQVVQHGNAGQDRLTNTRVFLVGRLIQLAVFPLGMDWHLPHHLFPMVPHYRLKELHELLLGTQEYREHATIVEGYFFHRNALSTNPTVLDLMAAPPV